MNAAENDAAGVIHEITRGGADVALEALGIEATVVGAVQSLRKLGRMVMVGMPAGAHARMHLPMDVVYSGQLAIFGTRGRPAWRYPGLLSLIEGGQVDLSPLVTRHIGLGEVSRELAAFDAPAPPGVAVVTGFTH